MFRKKAKKPKGSGEIEKKKEFKIEINGKEVTVPNKHPHDTVEQELALILTVSALLVAFAGLIVDSVDPNSFAYFEEKCIEGQTSNISSVKAQAYWCNTATNNLAICSWVAMLGSGMGYLGSIVLYVSWRTARPAQDDDEACNAFYRTINYKILTIYAMLVIAIITIAGAQFMLQVYKFDFQYHWPILYIALAITVLILLFLAWVVYDYRKHILSEEKKKKTDIESVSGITRMSQADITGTGSTSRSPAALGKTKMALPPFVSNQAYNITGAEAI